MNILVLHNNNIPFFLRDPGCTNIGDYHIDARLLKYDNNINTMSFDSYVSSELSFLKDSSYDIILLPFTFSEENYLEYTGVRVAAHIRLTPNWGKLTTPLLFIGPDTTDDVTKLSELGHIVNSYHVFVTDLNEQEYLFSLIDSLVSNHPSDDEKEYLTSEHYQRLLHSLNIHAPANYATHHSIANEWAIIRWIQMFSWKGDEPQIKDKSILDMLYFKLLQTKAGVRENFTTGWKKKHIIDPIIRGIVGRKILYVDDEGCKGWNSLLGTIIKNSEAEFIPYPFNVGLSKNELIASAQKFIDDNEADCYLVDLRLHDDDFNPETESKDFSGVKIARYIKSKNLGNQVVMFTASNKTWNYEEAVYRIGVNAYLIKESPEYNYSRTDSYQNFCKFSNVIRNAVNQSYIATYVKKIEECSYMEDKYRNSLRSFVEMLALNEQKTLRTNIMNLAVFIESYILDRFKISGTRLISNGNDETITYHTFHVNCIHFLDNFSTVRFYDDPKPKESNSIVLDASKPASVIILALHYHYGLTENECSLYLKLRNERNGSVAHHGGETIMSILELNSVFEKIITKILDKDRL